MQVFQNAHAYIAIAVSCKHLMFMKLITYVDFVYTLRLQLMDIA
jgi:hypothetical protein